MYSIPQLPYPFPQISLSMNTNFRIPMRSWNAQAFQMGSCELLDDALWEQITFFYSCRFNLFFSFLSCTHWDLKLDMFFFMKKVPAYYFCIVSTKFSPILIVQF